MNMEDAVNVFLADRGTYCAPKTIKNYKEHLAKFLAGVKAVDTEELTADDIRRYILALRDAGVRNVTVRCYMRSVKAYCSWLSDSGHMASNPTIGIKLPRPDPELKQPLSMDEVRKIDSAIDCRDRAVLHLMLDAGLRASEVCNLRWDDIDFVNDTIRISNGKYSKSRIVPLAPCLKQTLQPLHAWHPCRWEEHVFHSRRGEPLTVNAIKLLFGRIKRRTGIRRVHAHLCRHTFATSYIIGGGNMEQLRIMLGHADYNVTQNYLHLAAQFGLVQYPIYQLDSIFFRKGY